MRKRFALFKLAWVKLVLIDKVDKMRDSDKSAQHEGALMRLVTVRSALSWNVQYD